MLPKRFAYVQYIDVKNLQLMIIENTDKDLPSLNCRNFFKAFICAIS